MLLSFADMTQVTLALEAARPQAMDIFGNLEWVAILSLMAWGLGYFGQCAYSGALHGGRFSQVHSKRALHIGMTWMTLCLGGAVAAGFFGIALPAASGAGRLPSKRQP